MEKLWEAENPPVDALEKARRKIDLVIVSVLLDAGAGPAWKFEEPGTSGKVYNRSEGLGIASLCMFKDGMFIFYTIEILIHDFQVRFHPHRKFLIE